MIRLTKDLDHRRQGQGSVDGGLEEKIESQHIAALACHGPAGWREFRLSQMPNGNVHGCLNRHFSSGGGGPRNSFGRAVEAIVKGPGFVPFWTATLAEKDSDGDGFTNDQELGDPTGSGKATPGAKVTNPGDAASRPAALPPPFTDIKVQAAGVALTWKDGRGPFIVQRKSLLSDAAWTPVLTNTTRSATVPWDPKSGFFRIADLATQ